MTNGSYFYNMFLNTSSAIQIVKLNYKNLMKSSRGRTNGTIIKMPIVLLKSKTANGQKVRFFPELKVRVLNAYFTYG